MALRRAGRLAEAEVARLEALFAAHAELGRAWVMLQELHGLHLTTDDAAAMECLERFSRLCADDPLPEFYKVVDTLLHWSPEIFAFTQGPADLQRPPREHQQQARRAQAHGVRIGQRARFEARSLLLCPPAPT